jgi:transposase
MNAYSTDLRQRVLNAVDAGTPRSEVARLFEVSLSSIKRWLQQRRQTGSIAAKPRPGAARRIRLEQHATLEAQLRAKADATLEAHCQQWHHDQGQVVSVATMSRALKRAGWTHKKSKSAPVNVTKRLA